MYSVEKENGLVNLGGCDSETFLILSSYISLRMPNWGILFLLCWIARNFVISKVGNYSLEKVIH